MAEPAALAFALAGVAFALAGAALAFAGAALALALALADSALALAAIAGRRGASAHDEEHDDDDGCAHAEGYSAMNVTNSAMTQMPNASSARTRWPSSSS